MADIHTEGGRSVLTIRRTTVLSIAMLVLVAGSQWGMLWLASTYLTEGRALVALSPEAMMGVVAIAIAMLTIPFFPHYTWRPQIDVAGRFLIVFLVAGCISELMQPDPRLRNLPTFISIGAYYLIGRSIGTAVVTNGSCMPAPRALLTVYTIWYLWMLAFLISGELGFYGLLPETNIPRLQFRAGFTATEIPIFVGFQLPVLLCILLSDRSTMMRVWSGTLTVCALAIVVASISAGAMVATMLTIVVFLLASKRLTGMKWILIGFFCLVTILSIAGGMSGIFESVYEKIDDIQQGEGERGRIYTQLIADMAREPLLGIGRGRFVESHQLSWLGEGIYPHSNLLGIGAELGLPALFLFVLFAFSASIQLARGAFGPSTRTHPNIRLLAAMALAMFLYQQVRGLLQDTWEARETYVWLGVGIGATLAVRRPHARG